MTFGFDPMAAGNTNYLYRLMADRVVMGERGGAPGNVPPGRFAMGSEPAAAFFDTVPPASDWSGWVQGYFKLTGIKTWGSYDSQVNTSGVVAGVERELDDDRVFGVFGNYTESALSEDFSYDTFTTESAELGSYLSGGNGLSYFFLAGALGGGSYQFESFGGFWYSLNRTSGWRASTYYEQGLTFDFTTWVVQPYLALPYVFSRGYGSDHSLRPTIGARVARPYVTNWGTSVIFQCRALWQYETQDTYLTARAPVIIGFGFNWKRSQRWNWFADCDVQLDSQEAGVFLSGGLQCAW